MRINFTLPILVMMSMFVVCVSCSKDSQEEMVLNPSSNGTKVINASLVTGETYELPLTSTDIQIHTQAIHYSFSAIDNDSKQGMRVYKYIPADGFTGDDQVTLSDTKTYTRQADGGDCNNRDMYSPSQTTTSTTFITIKFKVTK